MAYNIIHLIICLEGNIKQRMLSISMYVMHFCTTQQALNQLYILFYNMNYHSFNSQLNKQWFKCDIPSSSLSFFFPPKDSIITMLVEFLVKISFTNSIYGKLYQFYQQISDVKIQTHILIRWSLIKCASNKKKIIICYYNIQY